jgi:hypothetical protein
MMPTYEELKAKVAELERKRGKSVISQASTHPPPRQCAAISPTHRNRPKPLTPAQRRGQKILFWWYVTLAICLYAIIQLSVEWGIKGFFAGVGLSIVWNLVYWTKDTHFIH